MEEKTHIDTKKLAEAIDREFRPKVEGIKESMIQIGVSAGKVMKEITKNLPAKE